MSMIRSCPDRLEFKNECYPTVNRGPTYNPTVRRSDSPIVRQMLYFFES